MITSLALLLVIVIGAFSASGITFIKLMGVGMIVALIVDATVVRMLLVPGDHAAARPAQLVGAEAAAPPVRAVRPPRGRRLRASQPARDSGAWPAPGVSGATEPRREGGKRPRQTGPVLLSLTAPGRWLPGCVG